ncbi:MAG: hypothetical protein IJQ90_01435 [Alphaproteobacteria bacterium]|nr:hypothetical protein [Alphaproteobacteria bacterium]
MILKYDVLVDLPPQIRNEIMSGNIALYSQQDGFDDRGTKYIMVVGDLYFRINVTGKLILPPLDKMPENADRSDLVILQKD